MAEYIDKQTVIDTLDGLCDVVCQYSKKQRAFMCGACNLGSAFDVLQELPAADVRPVEWIPVTERLPEVRTWVLCYCRANSFDVFRMTDEGNWQYGNRSIYMKGYVTHWMPLPPAPKEE